MRLKDKETPKDIQDRLNVDKKTYNSSLVLGIVLILLLLICLAFYKQVVQTQPTNSNIGNPYNCMDCKKLGKACSKHREFDKENLLRHKIMCIVDSYDSEMTEKDSKEALYGKDMDYNNECDFCKKDKKECYSCKYDREFIVDKVKQMETDEVLISKLCDDCWKDGMAKCDKCKAVEAEEILDRLN